MLVLSVYVLFAPSTGGPSLFEGSDKVVHALLFGALAATTRWRFGPSLLGLGLVSAYAVVSEVVQGLLLSTRSGDPYDVVADLLGVAAGWLLVRHRLRRG